MEAPKKMDIVRKIVNTLEMEIIQGHLKPKEHLTGTGISKRFNISRTPVREAMRVLESTGFVVFSPFKGWRVKEVSMEEVREAYVIRAHLASLTAELACQNLTNANLELLEKILGEMNVAVQHADVVVYFDLNVRFHHVIERAAGNGTLAKIMESIDKMTLRYRFLSLSLSGRLKASFNEHSMMVKAFRERDSKEVATIAKESALSSGKLLVESFFTSYPAVAYKL